jgi:hypothetical protein
MQLGFVPQPKKQRQPCHLLSLCFGTLGLLLCALLLPCVCLPPRHSSGVGAAFNVICLVMCFIFPAKTRAATSKDDSTDGSSSGGCGCFGRSKGAGATDPITVDMANKDVESATV